MPATRRTLLATAAAGFAIPAAAQPAWPARPLRLVIPFSAGGATDVTARLIAERLTQSLGHPVVADNRPGAGGNLAAELVAKADPDGYTLLMATIGTASINQHLYARLGYDPVRDFADVALVNAVANGIIVHPSVPVSSFAEFVAYAKANPTALNYGTPGNGTSGHLSGEYLKFRAGIAMQHVPYRGTSGVLADLLGARVQLAVDNLPAYLPQVREGKLKLLAVTSQERWFAAPDVPTVAEAGIPDFAAEAWFGVAVPARTPRPVVDRLAADILAAVADPTVAARLREIGSAPRPLGPEAFSQFAAAESTKWAEVVRRAGIRLE